MFTWQELTWFLLIALALVLTPGPNMIYCISRTLCQGRRAGLVSLLGVGAALSDGLCADAAGPAAAH